MSHPESDGIAEMLEGGHRALLTGVQRWLELLNRRHADRSTIAARIAQRSVDHDLAHRRTVEAVTTPARPGLDGPAVDEATIRETIWNTSSPAEWERAELLEALTSEPSHGWDIDAAVDTQARILGDWKVDRAHHDLDSQVHPNVFDDRYLRAWAAMEATDTQLDLAEERAATLLAQAPAGADRSPAAFRTRLLDQLSDVVAADAHTAFSGARDQQDAGGARRIAQAPTDLAAASRFELADDELQDLHIQQQHDSHEVRVARAEQLAAEHFEPDVTESAMIHDLSFGTPASQAATTAQPARRPARAARTASRPNIRQRSGSGR